MTIGFIAKVKATPGANGGSTVDAFNSSGANFIVNCTEWYTGSALTVTDFYGNTYTSRTAQGGGGHSVRVDYKENATVGADHTVTASVTNGYPAFQAYAFSGVLASGSYNKETTATGASALASGTITPDQDDSLIINAMVCAAGTGADCTIDSGYATSYGNNYSANISITGYSSYLIQTTAGASNPSWSWAGAGSSWTAPTVFKPSVVTAKGFPFKSNPLQGLIQR